MSDERNTPVGGDRFEEERAMTSHFERVVEALEARTRDLVDAELAGREVPLQELEATIRRVAREEVAAAARGPGAGAFKVALMSAGMVLVVLAGVWGVSRIAAGPAGPELMVASPVEGDGTADTMSVDAAGAAVEPPPPTPAEVASAYDSLFAARAPAVVQIVDRLSSVAASPSLRAALAAWDAGQLDPLAAARIHDGLVQLALKELVDSTLVVDGQLLRSPACAGQSCGALLSHWQARAGDGRYPPVSESPATDRESLAVVERVLLSEFGAIR